MTRTLLPSSGASANEEATGACIGRLFAFGAGVLSLAACSSGTPSTSPATEPVVELDGRAIGTTWSLLVVDPEEDANPDALRSLVEEAVARIDLAASNWREDSEIAAIDALAVGEELSISEDLSTILNQALLVHLRSEGAFDPTVGPLVAAYGFGAGASEEPPTEAELDAAAARLGFDSFDWNLETLTRTRADVSLDLSGVAKGYAVDAVAAALLRADETRFLIEIGGEIRAQGERPGGGPWRLGIFEPIESRAIHGRIELTGGALATSGDYRAFRDLPDGTRVSHTIDPRIGRVAASGVASATVVAPLCVHADAYATALMVLDVEEGLELVESLEDVEAYLLVHAGDGFEPRASSGFPTVEPLPDERTAPEAPAGER